MSIINQTVDLNGVTTWPTTAQVVLDFTPKRITVVSEHGSAVVLVSFDGGTTTAGRINSAVITGQEFGQQVRRVWLRPAANPAATCNVTVTAED